MVDKILNWHFWLTIAAIVLVFLRDDRRIIYRDFKSSFRSVFTLITYLFLFLILGWVTIPFSVARILNKWLS